MGNVFYFEHAPQIESLIARLGALEVCERLGFVDRQGDGIWHLSIAGFGYLLHLAQIDGDGSLEHAEAFAAGYQCAHDEVAR